MSDRFKKLLATLLVFSLCFAGSAFAEVLPETESDDELSAVLSEEDVLQENVFQEELLIFEEVIESDSVLVEEEVLDIPQSEEDPAAVSEEAVPAVVEDPDEAETEEQVPFFENDQTLSAEIPAAEDSSLSIPEEQPAEEPQELLIEEIVAEEESVEELENLYEEDYSPLDIGMRSETVLSFQQALWNKGYAVDPDGFYGYETALIVKIFQMYNGLPATGIADVTTKNAALGDGISFYEFGKGTNSQAVVAVQVLLRDLGYLTAVIDGDFGDKTEIALMTFQKYNGLVVDGSVGMQTLRSILSSPIASYGSTGLAAAELKKGDTGREVEKLQSRLEQLGFLQSVIDGEYGMVTEKAVKAFQMYNNLSVTGIADQITIAFLNSANAVPFYTIQYGTDGYATWGLQTVLQYLGFLTDPPDGIYGIRTRNAVALFQTTNGLYTDGIAGPLTINRLFSDPLRYDPSVSLPYSEVELLAIAVLDQVGWNLYSAFEWSVGMSYNLYLDIGYTTSGTAIYSFRNYYGNCISMATTFYWMARMLGYSVRTIYGSVPYRAGGSGPHAWVEIDINGGTYICDPDFEMQTGNNGYLIYYGQSGTWKYTYGYILSDY